VVLAAILLAGGSARGRPAITYRLSMPEPWTHLFRVAIELRDLPAKETVVDVILPVWRSGRYAIFDFAGGVVEFSASGEGGRALPWSKLDKSRWRVTRGGERSVRIDYAVYANEFVHRTRGLNSERGFVDGTAVFMYAEELRGLPVDLLVTPCPGWHVTTGLQASGDANRFRASSYDVLADSPLEIGTQRDREFIVEGKPHTLSISGTFNCDVDSLIADISAIVRVNARFWGGLPYDRYVFLLQAFPGASGGTEHSNSAVIGVEPDPSPRPRVRKDLRGLLSHEFFHTWNVKKFRPKGMDPYDWTKENYYRELWLAEGGTSYMHGRLLARGGLADRPTLESLAAWIQSEEGRPGNRSQSVAECSFDAWVKFSRRTQQAFNFETDLYSRGALVCALMDLEIRHRSGNAKSFDDLLRTLLSRFPAGSGGYALEDVESIAGGLSGSSMSDFFLEYVTGTSPVDWNRFFGYAGFRTDTVGAQSRVWWGMTTSDDGGRTSVRNVVRGSCAYAAGLEVGDEIIALDGYRVNEASLSARMVEYAPGDSVRLTICREGRLRDLEVPLTILQKPAVRVVEIEDPTDLQKEIRRGWFTLQE
jgi:predicted metalloprotease with PDZ domain